MYQEQHKRFLEELQSLDEPTKKKILIVATAVVMVVVIYFWLAYFNNLIANVGQPGATVAESQPAAAGSYASSAASPGIWQGFANGTGFIYGSFVNMLHGFGNLIQAPRQYLIKPPQ